MSWLLKIDSLYSSILSHKENKNYIFYPKIEIETKTKDVDLIFRKRRRKTQFLFKDKYNRSIYLTDVDIIKIIVEADSKFFFIIINFLIGYLEDKYQNISSIIIDDESYDFDLLFPVDKAGKEIQLLIENTFLNRADFFISYYDLLILISLIVSKEKLVSDSEGETRKRRQIKKFVVLASFYKTGQFKNELKEIGYNTEKSLSEVYSSSSIAKKVDLIFDKFEVYDTIMKESPSTLFSQ
ncbi:hypothetical protein ABE073_00480 [Lederbergia citrisecunda]|uniref:hypothetical protein n=1 Tax=Lederbergia citrisecunda TaxID=2833583 RepID=UPI003D273720